MARKALFGDLSAKGESGKYCPCSACTRRIEAFIYLPTGPSWISTLMRQDPPTPTPWVFLIPSYQQTSAQLLSAVDDGRTFTCLSLLLCLLKRGSTTPRVVRDLGSLHTGHLTDLFASENYAG